MSNIIIIWSIYYIFLFNIFYQISFQRKATFEKMSYRIDYLASIYIILYFHLILQLYHPQLSLYHHEYCFQIEIVKSYLWLEVFVILWQYFLNRTAKWRQEEIQNIDGWYQVLQLILL